MRSAPSTPDSLSELDRVLPKLPPDQFSSAIVVGPGRGRNLPVLCTHFDDVVAVENPDLLAVLEDLIAERGITNCSIIAREKFDPSACTASAAFLIYVLHIIPQIEMRENLLRELATIIGSSGKMVVVVPGSDSKYRNSTLKNAVQYGDGLAMLHDNGTYTFYKDFSPSELDKFLSGCGFQVEEVIGGDHKYIRIVSPDPDY